MNNFTYLIKQGIRSVWKNRFMSFASLCIMTVSLIMAAMPAHAILDCGIILDNVSDKNEISVYLDDDADVKHIGEVLKSNTLTESAQYISPEEGLKKMIEQYSEQKELFESLPYNPVPATYMVTINDIDRMSTAVQQFKAIDGVYKVNAPMDFASFIKDLRATFTIIGIVLIAALGTVSVIIISNTTRLSVFARRKEISIMRIVGATNSFIKTPFFVEGMFIGLLSGVLSWFVTKLVYENLFNLFTQNLGMWNALGMGDILQFNDITWYVLAACCGAGALLGAIGTVLSTGKYLKV